LKGEGGFFGLQAVYNAVQDHLGQPHTKLMLADMQHQLGGAYNMTEQFYHYVVPQASKLR
jgi:hypothetical protein